LWEIYLIAERILDFENDCDQLRKYKAIRCNWLYNVAHASKQSESGGNVNILEGDDIGHCAKNAHLKSV
jgi:hypothetical protein